MTRLINLFFGAVTLTLVVMLCIDAAAGDLESGLAHAAAIAVAVILWLFYYLDS